MNPYEQMRKSLKAIHRHIQAGVAGHTSIETTLLRVKDEINKALAVPPRNCDVGTAKEQFERFHKYCPIRFSADKSCRECPIMVERMKKEECGKWDCGFEFLQMPYESESTTNKNQNK